MTTIKVDTITNAAGSGAPNIPDGVTIGGTALASINSMDYTASGTQPTSPKNGAIWWDTGNDKFFQYMNGAWIEVSYTDLPPPWYGNRGVFSGTNSGNINPAIMDYINISTPGNATRFGNLSVDRFYASACSNSTRGVFGGGMNMAGQPQNTLDYITIATTSDATDFGDLTVARYLLGACSDGTRGLFAGGEISASNELNTIDYITIATTGNAQDFGDLSSSAVAAACANKTYGLFILGTGHSSKTNALQYVTIATLGNATNFGDTLSFFPAYPSACSNETYGVFTLGQISGDMEYVTLATPSNATDFGNLTASYYDYYNGATSDGTYGVFGGGDQIFSSGLNNIEYITINTPSNATDFGDLTTGMGGACATSGN